jgi:hypothetical protein
LYITRVNAYWPITSNDSLGLSRQSSTGHVGILFDMFWKNWTFNFKKFLVQKCNSGYFFCRFSGSTPQGWANQPALAPRRKLVFFNAPKTLGPRVKPSQKIIPIYELLLSLFSIIKHSIKKYFIRAHIEEVIIETSAILITYNLYYKNIKNLTIS